MTARVQHRSLLHALQELAIDAASLRLAAESLHDVAGEVSHSSASGNLRQSVEKFQVGAVAFGASLLAIVRRTERALLLAELGEERAAENDANGERNYSQASAKESRESAVNALAAALIKTSRGDITRQEDLIPALHAAENVIDAVSDCVLARVATEAFVRPSAKEG